MDFTEEEELLCENVAMCEETLLETYLEEGTFDLKKEVRRLVSGHCFIRVTLVLHFRMKALKRFWRDWEATRKCRNIRKNLPEKYIRLHEMMPDSV